MPSLLEGGHYMSVSSLGKFTIEVTPDADDPQIMHVDASAETRKEVVSMRTNQGENPDQFGMRIRGMVRALLNGEHRIKSGEELPAEPKGKKRAGL